MQIGFSSTETMQAKNRVPFPVHDRCLWTINSLPHLPACAFPLKSSSPFLPGSPAGNSVSCVPPSPQLLP